MRHGIQAALVPSSTATAQTSAGTRPCKKIGMHAVFRSRLERPGMLAHSPRLSTNAADTEAIAFKLASIWQGVSLKLYQGLKSQESCLRAHPKRKLVGKLNNWIKMSETECKIHHSHANTVLKPGSKVSCHSWRPSKPKSSFRTFWLQIDQVGATQILHVPVGALRNTFLVVPTTSDCSYNLAI